MARSRLFAGFSLITCMFILLLIFLITTAPAMGYYLLLTAGFCGGILESYYWSSFLFFYLFCSIANLFNKMFFNL